VWHPRHRWPKAVIHSASSGSQALVLIPCPSSPVRWHGRVSQPFFIVPAVLRVGCLPLFVAVVSLSPLFFNVVSSFLLFFCKPAHTDLRHHEHTRAFTCHPRAHTRYALMRATYAPTTYVPDATHQHSTRPTYGHDWPGPHVHAACLMR
jgi:hypothetical protein